MCAYAAGPSFGIVRTWAAFLVAAASSCSIGSDEVPALASPAAFREAVLRYAEAGVPEVVLVHPDHPAEARVAHGPAAPDIVRRIAEEVLPELRAELG